MTAFKDMGTVGSKLQETRRQAMEYITNMLQKHTDGEIDPEHPAEVFCNKHIWLSSNEKNPSKLGILVKFA